MSFRGSGFAPPSFPARKCNDALKGEERRSRLGWSGEEGVAFPSPEECLFPPGGSRFRVVGTGFPENVIWFEMSHAASSELAGEEKEAFLETFSGWKVLKLNSPGRRIPLLPPTAAHQLCRIRKCGLAGAPLAGGSIPPRCITCAMSCQTFFCREKRAPAAAPASTGPELFRSKFEI